MRKIALAVLIVPLIAVPARARVEPVGFVFQAPHFAVSSLAQQGAGSCQRFYPPMPEAVDGTAVLSAHILPDGRVSAAKVTVSSGNPALDKAAAACLRTVQLSPRTRDGIAVDVDWQMEVVWPTGRVRTARADNEDDTCDRFYPSSAARAGREGETIASFVIGADGSVSDVGVIQSSGHPDLDKAAIACVSNFRYFPAMQQGKPVQIDGTFVATWGSRARQ